LAVHLVEEEQVLVEEVMVVVLAEADQEVEELQGGGR
jgi:hypothetical protein